MRRGFVGEIVQGACVGECGWVSQPRSGFLVSPAFFCWRPPSGALGWNRWLSGWMQLMGWCCGAHVKPTHTHTGALHYCAYPSPPYVLGLAQTEREHLDPRYWLRVIWVCIRSISCPWEVASRRRRLHISLRPQLNGIHCPRVYAPVFFCIGFAVSTCRHRSAERSAAF